MSVCICLYNHIGWNLCTAQQICFVFISLSRGVSVGAISDVCKILYEYGILSMALKAVLGHGHTYRPAVSHWGKGESMMHFSTISIFKVHVRIQIYNRLDFVILCFWNGRDMRHSSRGYAFSTFSHILHMFYRITFSRHQQVTCTTWNICQWRLETKCMKPG